MPDQYDPDAAFRDEMRGRIQTLLRSEEHARREIEELESKLERARAAVHQNVMLRKQYQIALSALPVPSGSISDKGKLVVAVRTTEDDPKQVITVYADGSYHTRVKVMHYTCDGHNHTDSGCHL